MRFLYSLLLYLSIPLVLTRLLWRSIKAPDYRRRWRERFGFCPFDLDDECIWVHAVSFGEVQAALPLIRALQARYPRRPVVVTTTTPTGSYQVREALGATVHHCYMPYDLPRAIHRFIKRARPGLLLVMETELWPNLFHVCQKQRIPVIVANTRLSQRSAGRYRRCAALTTMTLQQVTCFAVQQQADAERLVALGAPRERVSVTGNIKFDLTLPASLHEQAQSLRRDWGGSRPVWIAASTHAGEDSVVLQALKLVRTKVPDVLLVLVPRHPERFASVAALCREQGYDLVLRSQQQSCMDSTAVFIGDSMGELRLFYAAADIAFVGGSLVPVGGHNVLEPAALGKPVIFGPHMFNFSEAERLLLAQSAASQVCDAGQLGAAVIALLQDSALRLSSGERARQVVEQNRGALDKTLALIDENIIPASD